MKTCATCAYSRAAYDYEGNENGLECCAKPPMPSYPQCTDINGDFYHELEWRSPIVETHRPGCIYYATRQKGNYGSV